MKHIPRIGLLIETSRGYGQSLLSGIAIFSRLHGPWSFSRNLPFYRKSPEDAGSSPQLNLVDGIIAHTDDAQTLLPAIDLGIPMIVQGIKDVCQNLPTIIADDTAVGKMAAEHFLDRNFKNFAFCGFDEMYWSQLRKQGFGDAVQEAGYDLHAFAHPQANDKRWQENEQALLVEWLEALPKPVGIFACNDDRSQDIAEACMLAGLNVPQDAAILGVDNDELICELSEFPLSSIALSTEKAGYMAAELLNKMLSGDRIDNAQITIDPLYVVTRRSTDIFAMDDKEVATAARLIKESLHDTIAINDIADQVALSRRAIELRFRREMGCTINNYIQKERVARIKDLLLQTDWTVSQIAEKTGFSSATYMVQVFHKHMKETPLNYRKRHHPTS
ncbi:Xylose operon regulatory protein [Anaerohalosphaera lusitana]|uniref:Xylose operon regulatory protein n=1 Tax=Anaerohalosphaera lusitana TaxID=1936003 RepID=A0A1U9NNF3_9BACT|nr:XylR family transcriptional regulator [Anaerohalosphaera lusitana]AQT69046.1 Xylose operon regulatory protein [Anaerohalosphaera lusitana]